MSELSPTNNLRHVLREVNDGNGDIKVLALQQWWWDESKQDGEWRDVEINFAV